VTSCLSLSAGGGLEIDRVIHACRSIKPHLRTMRTRDLLGKRCPTLLQFLLLWNSWKARLISSVSFKIGSRIERCISLLFHSCTTWRQSDSNCTLCSPNCTASLRPSLHAKASMVHASRPHSYQSAFAAWSAPWSSLMTDVVALSLLSSEKCCVRVNLRPSHLWSSPFRDFLL
jgi:hypothetical protein